MRERAPKPHPTVAVVGRPNVGKSSLVNRILGKREAIVEETPGVTRDRRSFLAEWGGRTFELIDTGGIEPRGSGLDEKITEQAQLAIAAADVIVVVVDATTGPLQEDLEMARMLLRSKIPVVLAVNKVDRPADAALLTAPFYSLGLGEPWPLTALHGTGSGDLLDKIVSLLPEGEVEEDPAWAAVALVGRPNVGKSSILNALLQEERSIVSPLPGTTRDPIDSLIESPDGTLLRLVDTAGMRREVQIKDPVEYFSWLRSRGSLTRVDAAILVIDAAEGVTAHDQRIANEIVDGGRACAVVLNKWDLVVTQGPDRDRLDRSLAESLRFLTWAPLVRTSAVTGRGLDKILPAVEVAVGSHRTRLPTPDLNRALRAIQERRPHPRTHGKAVKVRYAVQASVAPPTIVLFANARLEENYLRYLENSLRDMVSFMGSPLKLEVRVKSRD